MVCHAMRQFETSLGCTRSTHPQRMDLSGWLMKVTVFRLEGWGVSMIRDQGTRSWGQMKEKALAWRNSSPFLRTYAGSLGFIIAGHIWTFKTEPGLFLLGSCPADPLGFWGRCTNLFKRVKNGWQKTSCRYTETKKGDQHTCRRFEVLKWFYVNAKLFWFFEACL